MRTENSFSGPPGNPCVLEILFSVPRGKIAGWKFFLEGPGNFRSTGNSFLGAHVLVDPVDLGRVARILGGIRRGRGGAAAGGRTPIGPVGVCRPLHPSGPHHPEPERVTGWMLPAPNRIRTGKWEVRPFGNWSRVARSLEHGRVAAAPAGVGRGDRTVAWPPALDLADGLAGRLPGHGQGVGTLPEGETMGRCWQKKTQPPDGTGLTAVLDGH